MNTGQCHWLFMFHMNNQWHWPINNRFSYKISDTWTIWLFWLISSPFGKRSARPRVDISWREEQCYGFLWVFIHRLVGVFGTFWKYFSGLLYYHRAIFTVFILSFWQQLFIYLLNFLNSTVGLIYVNLLIDFEASCKLAECDAPKTSDSCHNICLVIYSILFEVHFL